MKKSRGNKLGIFQQKTVTYNELHEAEETWLDVYSLTGWLDLSTGDSNMNYNAKLQNSTHVFLADYKPLTTLTGITSENSRMVVDGSVYEIELIDDPMGMHQHLEIYLKYLGGGLGV